MYIEEELEIRSNPKGEFFKYERARRQNRALVVAVLVVVVGRVRATGIWMVR